VYRENECHGVVSLSLTLAIMLLEMKSLSLSHCQLSRVVVTCLHTGNPRLMIVE
jgi:hypothetical protein